MKLSFSNRKWSSCSYADLLSLCDATGMQGLELYDVADTLGAPGQPFDVANARSTLHTLIDNHLCTVCFDTSADISDPDGQSCVDTLRAYIERAAAFRVPYVRVHTRTDGTDCFDTVCKNLTPLLPYAEQMGVTLLLETAGCFAHTDNLREILNRFASDSLGALWDMYNTCFEAKETPEVTITNLGAYVKHVHVRDSKDGEYCFMGEGDLPMQELVLALSSVNYDGFVSLEWDPDWIPDLGDPEIILTQFATYMERFADTSRAADHLYDNNTHTGKFVWKKDILIDMTFSQVLDRMAELFPDQYAFKYTTLNYTRTYAQFRRDVDKCARALISLGVRPGAKVAVWATNIPEWYIAFWAVTKLGGVLVTMNTAYKIHEAEYLLRQSDTHTLIMIDGYRDSNYRQIMRELCPEMATTQAGEPLHCKRLPFLRRIITCGFEEPGALTWEQAMTYSKKTPREELARLAAAVSPQDVCNMQYTSGTTGFPKGVMLTHYNIVNNGKCIGDRMDLSTADRMMIQVPMFHCFGMVLSMTAAMTHGASVYPLPYFSPRPALACIHQERITAFHGVPTMFIALLEHPDFAKTDFSHVRTGIMAGSPCPISVMRDVVDKMHMSEITIVYGQTEASPGCTMSSTDDPLEVRVGTVGRALPEIECKVVDPETGEEMPVGQNGEFVARGYNIMKGYYKMPRATAAAIDKDGWLHTGDLAAMTEDGNFRITGRLKDMIIRGGENIYPKEIEEFIYTHPKVKDVQVIGVPDEQYGEEIMACIILKEGESMTEKEMKGYILDHMARHKVPKYIDFVDSFPMNAAGKILKYKMREDAVKKLGLQKADSIVTA